MNKHMNARITLKHDTEENWLKAINFSPMKGELIIYDVDELHDYVRAKVGDGVTNVNSLPWFIGEKVDLSMYAIKEEVEAALASLNEKIDAGIPVEYVGF